MSEEFEKKLLEKTAEIDPADKASMDAALAHWKTVGKPLNSLGKLEEAVVRMAGIRRTADYTIEKKGLVIMCADNGVVAEGVTQTGQEVTAIVAENFTRRATSVCLMSEIAGVQLFPVDIGMASDVPAVTKPEYKVMSGTKDMLLEPAMTREQAAQAILNGISVAEKLAGQGYDLLATGEMGIGNTTTSSAVASVLLEREAAEMTGRGAGLSAEGLNRKIDVIRSSIAKHQPDKEDVLDVLSKVGGLDIAGLAGVFLGGALCHVPVIIDGFISSVAALCAARLCPAAADCMMPSHRSGEPAGGMILEALGLSPYIECNMSLGEGSGAVAAIPLLEMGLAVYREMSTFEQIHIEQYEDFED